MKKLLLLLGWGLFMGSLQAQVFSVEDLLSFPDYSSKRFDAYITKKGFVSSGHFLQSDSAIDTWDMIPNPADSINPYIYRRISRFQSPKLVDYSYQTSHIAEALATIQQFKTKGFVISDTNWNMQKPLYLQRREWIVIAEMLKEDTMSVVEMRWHKQHLPSSKRTLFVDDLLQFTSDEYLAAYFGRNNVRKDQFFFSEQEINKCSVLFPNTPNQVIFVWANNDAQKDILQVMVGGSTRSENVIGHTGVGFSNMWRFNGGITTHMRLDDLLKATGEQDLIFYGKKSPLYLSLAPESARRLELKNATIVFECINGGNHPLLNQEKVSAVAAIEAGLKLHISMLVLWPDAE